MQKPHASKSESCDAPAPLAGSAALVTGGARRIGRAIALRLAASGANVAITYRDSQPEAEETVRDLAALSVDAFAVRTDLTDAESIRQSVAAVIEEFGQLDILVNNAWSLRAGRIARDHARAVGPDVFPPTRARPSWSPRRLIPICARWVGGLSTSARWAAHIPGPRTPTTAPPRPLSTCSRRRWPRPGRPKVSVNCVAPE